MKMIFNLTPKNFDRKVIKSQLPVFVEFTTEWCGTSHIRASIVRDLSIEFDGHIKFCTVDIDQYQDIAKRFGINQIPTILFFDKGKIVDFVYGSISKEILISKVLLITKNKKEIQ